MTRTADDWLLGETRFALDRPTSYPRAVLSFRSWKLYVPKLEKLANSAKQPINQAAGLEKAKSPS
jgi:hypothetical protein